MADIKDDQVYKQFRKGAERGDLRKEVEYYGRGIGLFTPRDFRNMKRGGPRVEPSHLDTHAERVLARRVADQSDALNNSSSA